MREGVKSSRHAKYDLPLVNVLVQISGWYVGDEGAAGVSDLGRNIDPPGVIPTATGDLLGDAAYIGFLFAGRMAANVSSDGAGRPFSFNFTKNNFQQQPCVILNLDERGLYDARLPPGFRCAWLHDAG